MTDGCDISSEIALRWTSLDLSDNKSTLVQVMVWCRQASSHYLNQCWPRSLPPYGVTRPQWVNTMPHGKYGHNFQMHCLLNFDNICCNINSVGKSNLVQVMAWCRNGDRPLSAPMKTSLLHKCITRPQCFDSTSEQVSNFIRYYLKLLMVLRIRPPSTNMV